jgi:hypothetical protein
LGRYWIHANRCVPFTLRQFLIQWIDDKIEVVHANTSTYIALDIALAYWQHESIECLSGRDFSGYNFLSITKDKFVHVSI